MNDPNSGWKRNSYVLGTLAGSVLGALTAYLYNRAAEEEAERNGGQPAKIPSGQLIGLSLAVLGIVRQITELGRPSKKSK
jgi:hypothetical protein